MRFSDGRLSNEKIKAAEDEELYELLTAVRGIGRVSFASITGKAIISMIATCQWTVDMFAIFSLRRPNIMPAGQNYPCYHRRFSNHLLFG